MKNSELRNIGRRILIQLNSFMSLGKKTEDQTELFGRHFNKWDDNQIYIYRFGRKSRTFSKRETKKKQEKNVLPVTKYCTENNSLYCWIDATLKWRNIVKYSFIFHKFSFNGIFTQTICRFLNWFSERSSILSSFLLWISLIFRGVVDVVPRKVFSYTTW